MRRIEEAKILIVGLGLIGGSYADALTAGGWEVGALDIRPEAISYALDHGIIRHGRSTIDPEYLGMFDRIVFALYPHVFLDWIRDNQRYLKSGALLTDVTGVKCGIVDTVQAMLRDDLEFIGAHPMAGREVDGVENASRELFRGANFIVTPTEKNTPEAVEACIRLGKAIGCGNVTALAPEKHDEMIGYVSQLTHCIAVALMLAKDAGKLRDYTGDSFRDLTRIAKINDEMWSELFRMNRTVLLEQMDLFLEVFMLLRDSLDRDDADTMRELMRMASERRTRFDEKETQHEHGIQKKNADSAGDQGNVPDHRRDVES